MRENDEGKGRAAGRVAIEGENIEENEMREHEMEGGGEGRRKGREGGKSRGERERCGRRVGKKEVRTREKSETKRDLTETFETGRKIK